MVPPAWGLAVPSSKGKNVRLLSVLDLNSKCVSLKQPQCISVDGRKESSSDSLAKQSNWQRDWKHLIVGQYSLDALSTERWIEW